MRTLYESILDDEDVLISNIENSISDPFTAIVTAFDSGISKDDFENIIQGKIFDKFVEKELYLNPKDFFWNVLSFTDYMISMSLYNKETGEYPLIIRYKGKFKTIDIEIMKFSSNGKTSKTFEYSEYNKILSNIKKLGFKKLNISIGKYNVYNKKI